MKTIINNFCIDLRAVRFETYVYLHIDKEHFKIFLMHMKKYTTIDLKHVGCMF